MSFPLIPVAIASLFGLAWWKKSAEDSAAAKQAAGMHGEPGNAMGAYGVLTPERQAVYEVALAKVMEPQKLEETARLFELQGLPAQADMLRKRARVRNLPPAQKKARREAYRKAINSADVEGVREMASAFAGEGCSGAALSLYEYADGLEAGQPAGWKSPKQE